MIGSKLFSSSFGSPVEHTSPMTSSPCPSHSDGVRHWDAHGELVKKSSPGRFTNTQARSIPPYLLMHRYRHPAGWNIPASSYGHPREAPCSFTHVLIRISLTSLRDVPQGAFPRLVKEKTLRISPSDKTATGACLVRIVTPRGSYI